MEFGVRLLGAVQLFFAWILHPLFLLRSWKSRNKRLPPISDPLLMISATELAEKIRKEEVTAEQVVRAYITRCKAVNPYLNAIVEQRYEDAIKEAHDIDRLIGSHTRTRDQLKKESPLLGVPITVKESVGLKGMSFSVGSTVRKNIKSHHNGESVENLRKAGAIPIAVTNTPELCLCWETDNLVTGRTNNPYDFSRTSGGSSGGEAALIASAASVAGVGSDIAGSIRIPAIFTGIFGHKPTPGYVSLEGHYPSSSDENFEKFLTVGPMTRYAEDLRLFLGIMAGKNADGLKLDEEVNLKDINVYYMGNAGESLVIIETDREIKKCIHNAVNHFKTIHGCYVQDARKIVPEMIDSVEISATVFFGMEGIPDLLSMSVSDNPKVKKNHILELFKAILGMSEFSLAALMFIGLKETNAFIPRSRYPEYCKQNQALRVKFKEFLGENGVFIYPTHPIPAYYHNQYLIKTAGVMYTMVFNTLCLPATHVPMGLNENGLPIGIQIVAGPGQDRLCLAVAKELEAVFKGWIPPPSS